MRIVFAGTSEIGLPVLEKLSIEHEVLAVITKPDLPSGRGRRIVFNPIKQKALELKISVWQPNHLAGVEAEHYLKTLNPEVLVNVAYGFIIPETILNIPKWGVINLHPSLLPRWRGAAPLQRALLAGDLETGVSIMRMDAGLDTGPIFAQLKFPILVTDTSATLLKKAGILGADLMLDVLNRLSNLIPAPQIGLTCYANKLTKAEAGINWHLPAVILEKKIRAMNPWPVAYTFFRGKRLRIWQAVLAERSAILPGNFKINHRLKVGTQGGQLLELIQVQPENGRIISASSWLNGLKGYKEIENFDEGED